MNQSSNNGGGAGVAAFFDNVDLIVRDALIGSHSDKIAPDAQRALRRIADKLSAGPEARATIESAMALPGKWREADNGDAHDGPDYERGRIETLLNCADELEATFGPAPPAGGGDADLSRLADEMQRQHDDGRAPWIGPNDIAMIRRLESGGGASSYERALQEIAREQSAPDSTAAADHSQQVARDALAAGGARVGQEARDCTDLTSQKYQGPPNLDVPTWIDHENPPAAAPTPETQG